MKSNSAVTYRANLLSAAIAAALLTPSGSALAQDSPAVGE
jgi:hypothetical protein